MSFATGAHDSIDKAKLMIFFYIAKCQLKTWLRATTRKLKPIRLISELKI